MINSLLLLKQVAERQGKYLSGLLNKIGKANGGYANTSVNIELGEPFVYKHLGSMATVGRYKALVDLRQSKVVFLINYSTDIIQFVIPQNAVFFFQFCLNSFCIFCQEAKGISIAGFVSWFIWRSAYLTRVMSWRNRLYVAINWLTTLLFGRDISRI